MKSTGTRLKYVMFVAPMSGVLDWVAKPRDSMPPYFEQGACRQFCGDTMHVRNYYISLAESAFIFRRGAKKIFHGLVNIYYSFLLNSADLRILDQLSDIQITSFTTQDWKAFFAGRLDADVEDEDPEGSLVRVTAVSQFFVLQHRS